jgi:lysophospholipase L1-like esterase
MNAGLPGDTVRGMLARLDGHITSFEPDYVIVWGGINDLYGFKKPNVVMGDLERIYEGTAIAGVEPIACTLTPVLGYDQITPRILELNDLITGYCKRHGLPLVELFAATSDGGDRLRKDYSDDGVHLNSSGYRRVAEAVGEVIIELLSDKI